MKNQWYALITLTMALVGCGGNADGTGGDPPGPPGNEPQILERASRSSAIAVSGDDALSAMVNTDSDSLSVFAADDLRRIAEVSTGEEPSSVPQEAQARSESSPDQYTAGKREPALTHHRLTGREPDSQPRHTKVCRAGHFYPKRFGRSGHS